MSDTLLMTTSGSAPAASTPDWNPARIVTSRQKRKSDTAKDPTVRTARLVGGAVGQAHERQRGLHVPPALGLGERREQQRQLHVAEGGEDGQEVVHLEHEADVARPPLREPGPREVADLVPRHGDAARG